MLHTLSKKLQETEAMPYPKKLEKTTENGSSEQASADTPSTSTGRGASSAIRRASTSEATTSSSTRKAATIKLVSDVNPQSTVSCTEKRKGKGQRKGKSKAQKKKRKEVDVEKCGVCGNSEGEAEEWIECDTCGIWYHRDCMNINDELWESYATED